MSFMQKVKFPVCTIGTAKYTYQNCKIAIYRVNLAGFFETIES